MDTSPIRIRRVSAAYRYLIRIGYVIRTSSGVSGNVGAGAQAPRRPDGTVEMLSCRVRACDHCLIHRLVLPCENFSDSSSSFPPVFYLKDPA